MEPLKVVLIGCGRRGQLIYFPILHALRREVQVTAVCDRVPELGEKAAQGFGVPYYDSIRQLVRDKPMEAALVVTPPSSHHAISCYLSSHGIHNLVETPICDTVSQAREMARVAEENGVFFRVGEQFFRDPFDLLSRQLVDAGVIGRVGRMTNYHTHLGYHNNSRFQVFAGSAPLAVQAFEHTMQVTPYINTERHYDSETFVDRWFHFPDDLLITDIAGNVKGALGRYPRPGIIEVDGEDGAILQEATWNKGGKAEVRLVPPERRTDGSGAYAESYPFEFEWRNHDGQPESRTYHSKTVSMADKDFEGKTFLGVSVTAPQGKFRVENQFLEDGILTSYHPEVAEHVRDFARLVRTGSPDPFTPAMAITSLVMEQAATLSARRKGAIIEMANEETQEIEAEKLAAVRDAFGLDPMDVEAMINFSFPKP